MCLPPLQVQQAQAEKLTNHKATNRHSPLQGTGAEKRPAIVSGIVTADARPILPRL